MDQDSKRDLKIIDTNEDLQDAIWILTHKFSKPKPQYTKKKVE